MSVKDLIDFNSSIKTLEISFKNKKYIFEIKYFTYLNSFERYLSAIENDLLNIIACKLIDTSYEINYKELLNFRLAYEFDNKSDKIKDYHITIACTQILPINTVVFHDKIYN